MPSRRPRRPASVRPPPQAPVASVPSPVLPALGLARCRPCATVVDAVEYGRHASHMGLPAFARSGLGAASLWLSSVPVLGSEARRSSTGGKSDPSSLATALLAPGVIPCGFPPNKKKQHFLAIIRRGYPPFLVQGGSAAGRWGTRKIRHRGRQQTRGDAHQVGPEPAGFARPPRRRHQRPGAWQGCESRLAPALWLRPAAVTGRRAAPLGCI